MVVIVAIILMIIKEISLLILKYCIVGDSSLFITYNGDILGCFQDFSGKCIVANIRNSNLKDIIKHKKDKVGRYEFCSNCNSNIAILNID